MPENANVDLKCINTIRTLSMDAVRAAKGNHGFNHHHGGHGGLFASG